MGRGCRPLALAACILGVAGCGGGHASGDLTVSAAASLKRAFTDYAGRFSPGRVRFSFAGSDVLAAQIERGVRPDLYASANVDLPRMLYTKRLVRRPVTFAANRLVLAAPAGSPKVRTVRDAGKVGVTLAIGSRSVPIGAYTRRVLARLGRTRSARILANVRSEEPDVGGIVGKLTTGAVDAGFTYATDVTATGGKLRAIALPATAQPVVAYAAAVLKGAPHPGAAARFISGLLRGVGRSALLRAGFLPPPRT